ncbi:uncharacterized protein LOC126967406 [Leptidea sinapis]|uniref:uncharacterized protein LOC126967406 n=1 Tax=Leptidea sinapis TaxID=189913 RepID=UPI0021301A99|nr:uncharacterized protein LOC126967406 [Leptidea sinapis]
MKIVASIFLFLLSVEALEELTKAGDNTLRGTEAIIRSTINNLFSSIKLKKSTDKSRFKEYITLHEYFMSLTLQDDYNLKRVVEEARAGDRYKNTYYNITEFIAIINEILDGDNKTNHNEIENYDVYMYIENFVERLKVLKDLYKDIENANVNKEVLEYLETIKSNKQNYSSIDEDDTEDDIVLSDNIETWVPSGRRIFKGERTKIKYFPFMASIHMFNNFHCAGSIIASDLIITASSCLQLAWNNRFFRENPAFLSVRVGSSFYGAGGEVIPVLEVYFHPNYNSKNLKNNLCLVRLTRHIKFSKRNKKVKKINIDKNPWKLSLDTPGITILGWGAKGRSGIIFDPWRNILSFASLDVYPLQECQEIYSKEYVTQKHFCAGFMSKGGGACNRDVGGPGVEDGKLMGVISFGSPVCGTPDSPTVFTKLGYYTDWIESVMEQEVPTKLERTTLKREFNRITPGYDTRIHKTTFKIAPLSGNNDKPMPVIETENTLRILDDELFKEFLSTMFSSKEIGEYRESLKIKYNNKNMQNKNITKSFDQNEGRKEKEEESDEERQEIKKEEKRGKIGKDTEEGNYEDIYQDRELQRDVDHLVTKMSEFDESQSKTEVYHMSQVEETESEESSNDEKVETTTESNMVKFIQDVDLNKIVKEEITTELNMEETPKNESLLTWLYISEEKHADDSDTGAGLSIPSENFDDMTRSKGNLYSYVPDGKLYSILSEVVDSEVEKKINED